jgi:hypothetical protein
MGIGDIQEAWSRLTADSSDKHMLNEEQIRSMLGKRSRNLMERIDFNIRIGFVILLVGIITIFSYDLTHSTVGYIAGKANAGIPPWLIVLDFVINLFILGIFITFFVRYFKIRRLCRDNCDLRHALMKVIGILTAYQRLFTITLVIIMLSSATGFMAGYVTSIQNNQTSEGFLVPVIVIGILLIALITWILFLLFRWIFRRIYGNYLIQLRETLAELDSPTPTLPSGEGVEKTTI